VGFFSWMSSCGTVGEDEPPSLVRTNDDSDLTAIQRQAAEDVARVEQDDRYFGGSGKQEI